MKKKVLICGAGASGTLLAILLARAGVAVTILERRADLAKKLLVSGNGKCNISNRHISPKRYHSNSKDAIHKILAGFGADEVIKLFKTLALEITEETQGRLYPSSFSAKSLIGLLKFELEMLKVKIEFDTEVKKIEKKGSKFFVETTKDFFEGYYLVLATGSEAMPKVGGSATGLELAKRLKHKIIKPLPSLVPFESDKRWPKLLAGLKIDARVKAISNNKKELSSKRGDLLFTKYGLSGLAILDLSATLSLVLESGDKVYVAVDIFPDLSTDKLKTLLKSRIKKSRAMPIPLWLGGLVHPNLAKVLSKEFGLEMKNEADLNQRVVSNLAYDLKNLKIPIKKSRGFEWAEVALGGVSLEEINVKTLESKLHKNLYFAGEILDVCGDRGGFNLHFAWVSAIKVSREILKREEV